LKENNEVFRDIILGYYDAVACEIQKLNQKVESIGGSKIIKLQYRDYIKPLTRLRNELAHQNAKIANQDEINEFLSNKLHGILKFIISIQLRLV
jgi:uncharacterized protein YutE (UPF0331/DUF86 family)